MRADETPVDNDAVRAELERVVASPEYKGSARRIWLLRYLVERALAGAEDISEAEIQAAAAEGPGAFAAGGAGLPVEARLLRNGLQEYYEGSGAASEIRIALPTGGYVPVFSTSEEYRPEREFSPHHIWLPLVGLTILAVIAGLIWHHHSGVVGSRRLIADSQRELQTVIRTGPAGRLQSIAGVFRDAVARDSGNAEGWAGLAESLACADFQGALLRDDAVTEARQAAATAIRLNGNLAPAHAALGYVKMIHDWDWNGAEVEFREAVRLDPSLPEAHTWYAKDLLITGRFDGALEQFRLAVPDPRLAASSLAQVLCGAHRYDEGIADARRGAEAFPGSVDAAISLGICLDAKGNHSEAIDAFQSAAARSPSTYALARLAQAEAANGDHKAAESILREIQRKAASDMGHEWTHIAMILASLGEVAQAVDSLERAVQWREPDVMFMGVDPVFDGIRSDARFTGLRKRLGLP